MNIKTFYQKFGEQRLVAELETVKFTPYFLHLRPDASNSGQDEFIKIECIQDVLNGANCNCTLFFDRYEYDKISDIEYFYFGIIEKETNEVIYTFYLNGEIDINMISKKLEDIVQVLVGHYNYRTSDFFYSKAVNNVNDEILTADKTIENEKNFLLKDLVTDYETNEKEDYRERLTEFIELRKNQGLSLFKTEKQREDFIIFCLKQLES